MAGVLEDLVEHLHKLEEGSRRGGGRGGIPHSWEKTSVEGPLEQQSRRGD